MGLFSNDAVDIKRFRKMLDTIVHRGPDEDGIFVEGELALGIRRLRIIDLDTGQQPIFNEDKSKVIVYNGEIYNFLELRKELVSLGHVFTSKSDTEVVLHAFEQWGRLCLHRFNGMFSFAIFDRTKRSLFLARDRLGIKPLFYSQDRNIFRFGSELRTFVADPSFPRDIDPLALDCYLSFGYVTSPRSMFKYASRLPAGCYLNYDGKDVNITRYWDTPTQIQDGWTAESASEELRAIFRKSVQRRMISDVPLGAFLSGGVDSSSVVGQMAELASGPVKTFTIGFRTPGYDELPFARAVAQKHVTDHHTFILDPDLSSVGDEMIDGLDEPLADSSIIPTYLVSQKTREHVTVALSGDGGDELFGGYDQYTANRIASWMDWLPGSVRRGLGEGIGIIPFTRQKKGYINKLKQFANGLAQDSRLGHLRWMLLMPPPLKASLYTAEFLQELDAIDSPYYFVEQYFNRYRHSGSMRAMTGVDLEMWIADDILAKVDRMSMLNSLEVRVPFLDHEIVEFVLRLHPVIRFQRGTPKGLCTKALGDLLPKEVMNRREKQGFSFPLRIWGQEQLRDRFSLYQFTDKSLGGRLNQEAVMRLAADTNPSRNTATWRWALHILLRWSTNFKAF